MDRTFPLEKIVDDMVPKPEQSEELRYVGKRDGKRGYKRSYVTEQTRTRSGNYYRNGGPKN
jgi:hypothetical protein